MLVVSRVRKARPFACPLEFVPTLAVPENGPSVAFGGSRRLVSLTLATQMTPLVLTFQGYIVHELPAGAIRR